jgi:hypothetical protein
MAKKICKNGVCRIVKDPPKKAAPVANNPPPFRQANVPVVPQAQEVAAAAQQGPVLPANINPAQVNPAQVNAQRPAPRAPLMNPQKGNYKSSPYKRNTQAGQNMAGGAMVGAGQGAQFGPKGAVIGATVGAGGGLLASLKDALINRQVKQNVRELNKLLFLPNKNDPRVAQRITQLQAKMNELAPGMLAPGQEHLPVEQQHEILAGSVDAANARGSTANYQGKGAPGSAGMRGAGGADGGVLQLPNFTQEQMGLQNELINRIGQNKADFGPIADTEYRRYQEELLPQIAQQYFGNNPDSFSGTYPRALGRGAEGLAERLSAMQQQFNAQREDSYLKGALQPAFGNLYIPGAGQQQQQPSFWQNLLTSAAPGAMKGFGEAAKQYGEGNFQWNKPQAVEGKPIEDVSQQQQRVPFQAPYSPIAPLSQSQVGAQDILQQQLMKQAESGNYSLGGRKR